MRLELYLALVLAGDRSAQTRDALESLGKAVADRQIELDWTYSGVAQFLKRRDFPGSPLGRLTDAVFSNESASSRDLEDALRANRELLDGAPQ